MDEKFKLKILLYHGVTSVKSKGIENISKKHIDINIFEKQMRYLNKYCSILSIDEVVNLYSKKAKITGEYFVVTFDDGFKNNFTNAFPILLKYNIPAIFYISTGMINSKNLFWVDQIECCVNNSTKKKFTININKRNYTFNLNNINNRAKALFTIKKICKKLSKEKKDDVITSLKEKLEIEPSVKFSKNYELLNWSDIRKMNKSKLIKFGAHTINHEILSYLSPKEMKKQISLSINKLGKELGEKVTHFSYPEGQKDHFDSSIIKYLKARGIVCSPSAISGVNDNNDDLFRLKRIMVGFDNMPFPK